MRHSFLLARELSPSLAPVLDATAVTFGSPSNKRFLKWFWNYDDLTPSLDLNRLTSPSSLRAISAARKVWKKNCPKEIQTEEDFKILLNALMEALLEGGGGKKVLGNVASFICHDERSDETILSLPAV